MIKEIWANKLTLLNNGTINNPLCTYQLPVLTGRDCAADGKNIYVNSFNDLFNNIDFAKCITVYRPNIDLYNELGIYIGSLWDSSSACPNKDIRGILLQLSYNASYINDTISALIPSQQTSRVGQLPIFMYTNITSLSAEKIIGAVVFIYVTETWVPYGSASFETRNYYKLAFITWKGDSNSFNNNSNLAVSAINFENAMARNNTYTTDKITKAECKLRILYSWWINSPSSDNIKFWSHSDAYLYTGVNNVKLSNSEFTNFASNGGFHIFSNDNVVYENYTLPWNNSSANLMVSVGIYFGNTNVDDNFIEQ